MLQKFNQFSRVIHKYMNKLFSWGLADFAWRTTSYNINQEKYNYTSNSLKMATPSFFIDEVLRGVLVQW